MKLKMIGVFEKDLKVAEFVCSGGGPDVTICHDSDPELYGHWLTTATMEQTWCGNRVCHVDVFTRLELTEENVRALLSKVLHRLGIEIALSDIEIEEGVTASV
jgi:hypothetical protein